MISKLEALQLVREFLDGDFKQEEWFKNIQEYIKAIVLYGSVAKGVNTINSDIDVLIILPLEIENKYTKGEYVYMYKDYEINIVCRSIEKLRELAKLEEKDLFQREVFRDSEIIWSTDDEVKGLIKFI
jgi:predicted nucleotidyltransferase